MSRHGIMQANNIKGGYFGKSYITATLTKGRRYILDVPLILAILIILGSVNRIVKGAEIESLAKFLLL